MYVFLSVQVFDEDFIDGLKIEMIVVLKTLFGSILKYFKLKFKYPYLDNNKKDYSTYKYANGNIKLISKLIKRKMNVNII